MSSLAALARLHATRQGRAERLRQVRHHHLVDEPLVLVILTMAGEAAAPLACMVGTGRRQSTLLTVTQPRNRDQRRAFYAQLAAVILPHIRRRENTLQQLPARPGKPPRQRCADAPQIIVANHATVDYLSLVGRSIRFQGPPNTTETDPSIALLGRWLTFFAERAEYPGSSMLLPLTAQLAAHWATGQSILEDESLSKLLAWIEPPAGLTGVQAALRSENPVLFPPAGPATDPTFDAVELEPRMITHQQALASGDHLTAARTATELQDALASQLRPTWNQVWDGLALLRAIPQAARSVRRWEDDRDHFTSHSLHITRGGAPQPVHDQAVDAARRLARLERAIHMFEDEQALDDPFVLAERRTVGTAFAGVVVAREPDRQVTSAKGRRILRPRFTIRTEDPPPIARDQDLVDPERPRTIVRVREVLPEQQDMHLITVEVTAGMGSVSRPAADAVPELDELVCYTAWPSQWGAAEFPSREQTPWTHTGPSAPQTFTDLSEAEQT
ncbi:hypothetical protein [Streptosporangium amethystogenes]|uniref:hypothetical protein n=1 Tax=Streptosporangium amethystogenes TaxID=2002 RepID=UPI0004C6E658|nr:hypothetical protein [Streptosporangium amethystogenes]